MPVKPGIKVTNVKGIVPVCPFWRQGQQSREVSGRANRINGKPVGEELSCRCASGFGDVPEV
jgi:hypothetical protein